MVLTNFNTNVSMETTRGDLTRHGFEVNLVEAIPKRLKCPLCKRLIREPIQTIRGELACGSCYEANARTDGLCPIDHEPISPNGYFKDRCKRTEIRNLKCFCMNKLKGCPWTGDVGYVEDHQSRCTYQPGCCLFCNKSTGQTQIEHIQECVELKTHKNCFYKDYGCAFKPSNIEDYVNHLTQDDFLHNMILYKHSQKSESSMQFFRNEIEIVSSSAQKDTVQMQAEIMFLNGQVLDLNNTIREMNVNLKRMQLNISENTNKEISSNTELLVDEDKISTNVALLNKKITELDLKQQLFENTTYNGKILWKIDNFKYRMQQAVIGRVTALHSAPCFTSKYEHKFCGRLYPNGDGMGKCTHLSLFFVIMKSQYDNLLQWPFLKKVMFRLINQEDTTKSIEESFLPDRFSSSFQKPTKDMNVAAGCPMFISKDDLMSGGYVKDDAIFIELIVNK